jgi:hypothetical protein
MSRLRIFVIPWLLAVVASSARAQEQHGTGLVFTDDDTYRNLPLASTAMRGTLPASKDLSSWFPTPGDQGLQASCVGWAVAYGLKSYQEAVERRRPPRTSTEVFSPSYVYNQIRTGDCGAGSDILRALALLRTEGVATIADFSYDSHSCNRQPSSADKEKARPYTIADWRKVDVRNHAEIKSQIVSGFPIVIGMYVDENFERLQSGSVYTGPAGRELGGHAMVVVGYDDARGAYKVLNSWGTSWGDNGFGWISYGAFERRVKQAFTAQDVVIVDPSTIVQSDPAPVRPADPPRPLPASEATVHVGAPIITHNQVVQSPIGPVPGMVIRVPGMMLNARGSQAQILVRFYYPDGRPLLANPQENVFRDVNGLAATGSAQVLVNADQASLDNAVISMPYYALNFMPTNGQMVHSIAVIAALYLNNFEKGRSVLTPMTLRW